ncbi:MAG TPA: phosphodiester glycosidase family protein [Mycobacteriales bacterium]|nr:phosphodiester glycosidase family protein [Mycobacteriales bacterium]
MTTSARKRTAVAAALCAIFSTPAVAHGDTAPALQFTHSETIAKGVQYRTFTYEGSAGTSIGYDIRADLTVPNVHPDLLHPPTVAASDTVSAMTRYGGAVAGTNADFFNITDEHAGVPPTFSSDGVEIAGGQDLKAAVPDGQRFGPALVPGTPGTSVFGTDASGTARLGEVTLAGSAISGRTTLKLVGLNQFALPENGVGVYTTKWGSGSLVRPTCGSDTDRGAPCSSDVAEAVIHGGKITQVSRTISDQAVQPGTTVLIGRENGADKLAALGVGQRISLAYQLVAAKGPQFDFAVGAEPIMRGGAPLDGVDTVAIAPRTGVGIRAGGHQIDLIVIDGRSSASAGVSIAEMTDIFSALGDSSAANLDGGGSSEMVARDKKSQELLIRNVPSDGKERSVANGVGIFTTRR